LFLIQQNTNNHLNFVVVATTTGMNRITDAGLMTDDQYRHAEEDLIGRLQIMREREVGNVEPLVLSSDGSGDEDSLDDPIVRSYSSERERAKDEFRMYCNIVKARKYCPRTFIGNTLQLGSIQMGKVGAKGDDIRASAPFTSCNLSDFIGDDGRFDLVSFFQLQKECFPTLYKLAVCLASIRTNEVGCERFFSTAGYISCPRRTSLKVRNYECLATLKANMQHVFIDENWVVDKYLAMEHDKSFSDLDHMMTT
jgi:hAT family C-terminal dimerisation region